MFDFETFATTPRSVVRCLSIVPFKLQTEETIEAIMSRALTVWFDPSVQIEDGREMDDDTLAFWERTLDNSEGQAKENARLILAGHPEDMHPRDALEIIAAYILDLAPSGLMYARGSNFDFPIFEDLCRSYNVTLPCSTWKFACSKSILRFICKDDKKVEASLVDGLKSNHSSAFDCAVEIRKLQTVYAVVNGD
jgi:hypothetical protein